MRGALLQGRGRAAPAAPSTSRATRSCGGTWRRTTPPSPSAASTASAGSAPPISEYAPTFGVRLLRTWGRFQREGIGRRLLRPAVRELFVDDALCLECARPMSRVLSFPFPYFRRGESSWLSSVAALPGHHCPLPPLPIQDLLSLRGGQARQSPWEGPAAAPAIPTPRPLQAAAAAPSAARGRRRAPHSHASQ